MSEIFKIGFGGSCHWCTEAIFQSLIGVKKVEQGWISSNEPNENLSEAVIVHYEATKIGLSQLIKIHLHTHSCTERHSMRSKYRSAVYTFSGKQQEESKEIVVDSRKEFEAKIITEVLPFKAFKLNQETYLNYYYSNPDKPFCQTYISPKLKLLSSKFNNIVRKTG